MVNIHRGFGRSIYWLLLSWIRQQNMSTSSTYSLHNKPPVHNKRSRSVSNYSQHMCNSGVASKWLQVHLWFLIFFCPTGRDADCIWSCRQGGFRSRYRQNMDTRQTEGDQTCRQELWLLSAKVGLITALGEQVQVKLNRVSRNLVFLIRQVCPLIKFKGFLKRLGGPRLLWKQFPYKTGRKDLKLSTLTFIAER